MRGALRAAAGEHEGRGIIPADAGSTLPAVERPVHTGDHPRGCGEHVTLIGVVMSDPGSSPRMRGARRGGRRF